MAIQNNRNRQSMKADYFILGRGAKYCDQRVCVHVCLSVSLSVHMSKTHVQISPNIFR